MPDEKTSECESPRAAVALSTLPHDELIHYAKELGLEPEEHERREDLLRHVRRRQELLIELDRDALLDIIVWSRQPVQKDATKEELAREIAGIEMTNYETLPHRGLAALARLRGLEIFPTETDEQIIARLRKKDGFWKNLGRARRSAVAAFVAKMVDKAETPGEYQFLPEDPGAPSSRQESLRKQIEERGLVGGLATRIKGAADDYVKLKLDEIEARIDAKLNHIDNRLSEWRDREVANRLKILRLTLMFTALVALLSLGYNAIKSRVVSPNQPTAQSVSPKKP